LQAVGLAIVFAGYLVGWRSELAGGVTTVVGTAVYIAKCVLSTRDFPQPFLILFAAPGVCYLLARQFAYFDSSGASIET
jgi:hypothetical protein